MSTSPTQLSLKYARATLGWRACVVEKYVSAMGRKIDAFGFGDILACGDGKIYLIQCTTTDHAPNRVEKIKGEKCRGNARAWLQNGGVIWVWGWAKRGKAGKRKLWTLREYPVGIEDVS